MPPPDRATLRRFRNVVADLGTDFYLALVDSAVAGLLHVTYARQIAAAPAARVEQLVVAVPFRRRGIAATLLRFAQQRAGQHGCGALLCVPADGAVAARHFLEKHGLTAQGALYAQGVGEGA